VSCCISSHLCTKYRRFINEVDMDRSLRTSGPQNLNRQSGTQIVKNFLCLYHRNTCSLVQRNLLLRSLAVTDLLEHQSSILLNTSRSISQPTFSAYPRYIIRATAWHNADSLHLASLGRSARLLEASCRAPRHSQPSRVACNTRTGGCIEASR
jgi:hypothetical protein